jgi:two-component system, NtrC family, nitrogen regulation response regulator NtrX
MAILSGERITTDDLPETGLLGQSMPPPGDRPGAELPDMTDGNGQRLTLKAYRERAERAYILGTLEETDWNISRAAVQLGVERTNLHKKMRSYGIKRD